MVVNKMVVRKANIESPNQIASSNMYPLYSSRSFGRQLVFEIIFLQMPYEEHCVLLI